MKATDGRPETRPEAAGFSVGATIGRDASGCGVDEIGFFG
jgi:hypothetical protein